MSDKDGDRKMPAEDEKEARPSTVVKLQPIPGCTRCRPKPNRPAPNWFYRSKSGTRFPALTLQDLENNKKYDHNVSEDQRLSRVQEWLRKHVKGGSMGELDKIVENQETRKKTNKEIMDDARKWHQKKATRTNETMIFSEPSDCGLPRPVAPNAKHSKQGPMQMLNKYAPLEPLNDQKSVDSNSIMSSSALRKYKELLDQRPGPVPTELNALRHYYERKQLLDNCRKDRTFSKGLHPKDPNMCRKSMGPIGRPHTPVRSLADRQRSTIGNDAWFNGTTNRDHGNDLRRMQSRTYELQSQLQQMLDKQQRG